MTRLRYILSSALLAISLTASPAAADRFEWPATAAKTIAAQERATYWRELRRGDRYALQATEVSPLQRKALVGQAQKAYELAIAAQPQRGEPHYRLGELLYNHYLTGQRLFSRRAAEQVIEHWLAFERLEPLDPRVTSVLFERALLRTRLATDDDLRAGIADYETLIRRTDLNALEPELASIWLGNLAEMYMMVGDLDASVSLYQRSMTYFAKASNAFGLAVALDRDGQGAKAREVMLTYADGSGFRQFQRDLREGEIFFVPPGEELYYLALGFEATGAYREAIVHYRKFIASGAHPQFQARARDNAAYLEKRLAEGSLRPTPVKPEVQTLPF